MKTKLEIIEETVTFYSEDTNRRAFDDYTGCQYLTKGRMCAVGRCLEAGEHMSHHGGVEDLVDNYGSDIWMVEYRGHDLGFWQRLQFLHDKSKYWKVGSGMTEAGSKRVKELIERYK